MARGPLAHPKAGSTHTRTNTQRSNNDAYNIYSLQIKTTPRTRYVKVKPVEGFRKEKSYLKESLD